MKKILFISLIVASFACKKNSSGNSSSSGDIPCGDHKSQQLYRQPDGRCYLFNSKGEKEYVENHECDC
jgi:hypothetical protein